MKHEEFQTDLKLLSSEELFRRYVLNGSCASISDAQVHAVKESLSNKFTVEYNDVVVVGSANLGFSIKPTKRYVPFGDDSDIDIAIVSRELFERVWREIYIYSKSGAVWPNKKMFIKYLFRGWIRPDLLPRSPIFDFSNQWWEYFRTLAIESLDIKIAGGIYQSYFFLEQYQVICIDQCKTEL
ncbi:hypothetical protein QEH56_20250 [Pelagicoccus enzymogenes]|uniref:hypothetical protein n=1 Tax=Pelagicoccus enzymogenes TaxID=2773457 RepID=UPI00280D7A5D|nr:hypothetical protein [Pelagicoccus enzymogenes]MDQ8200509.1 hypothetical protein [Pelagicoccus enzymogenes]